MGLVQNLVASVVTSGAVSALLLALFKSWMESRIRYQYQRDLEKLKSELTLHVETAHSLVERRLAVYPQLVALVYRIRNLARAVVGERHTTLLDLGELPDAALELENRVIGNRFYLEHDSVFDPIHEYKGLAIVFVQSLRDLQKAGTGQGAVDAEQLRVLLEDTYAALDTKHGPICQEFSSLLPDWLSVSPEAASLT